MENTNVENDIEVEFDLLVIGAGPGGYVAAIKASQLGMKVAVVEKREKLGGTCLNVGCIPSKALLHISKTYHNMLHKYSQFGIKYNDVTFNLDEIMDHKNNVINDNAKGIDFLFSKNKITKIPGWGKIIGPNSVFANDKEYKAKNILIATGSGVVKLPNIDIDENLILSSDGALSLKAVPTTMLIIGGGYIGLEMASIWAKLGTKITIAEFASEIVPMFDDDISNILKKNLEELGVRFLLNTKVTSIEKDEINNIVTAEIETNNEKVKEKFAKALVCVGRTAYTNGLFDDPTMVGVKLNEKGFIIIDENFKAAENIYAIGDVIGGAMLAHKAEKEAIVVAEIISGLKSKVNYDHIPSVIYTSPEIASIGKSEKELKRDNINYKIGKANFAGNGKARSSLDTDGFVKVLVDASDRILGIHIVSTEAANLIGEAIIAMEYYASAEDIAKICHPHPTMLEVLKEACMVAVYGKSIHT